MGKAGTQTIAIGPGAIREARVERQPRPPMTVMGIKYLNAWGEWLDRFATSANVSRQELLAVGAARLAEQLGFEPPPPRL